MTNQGAKFTPAPRLSGPCQELQATERLTALASALWEDLDSPESILTVVKELRNIALNRLGYYHLSEKVLNLASLLEDTTTYHEEKLASDAKLRLTVENSRINLVNELLEASASYLPAATARCLLDNILKQT